MSFSRSFIGARYVNIQTRSRKFLEEMESVLPWEMLVSEVQKRLIKQGTGRPRKETLLMLKLYFLQLRYNLSDPKLEEEIYERISFQRFLDLDILSDSVPDETTILRFRHFLENNNLQEKFFHKVNRVLKEKGILLETGTIMDATIIDAPTSTKNKEGKRDPEMHSTKKGNQWYFGMKAHIGTDTNGLVHSAEFTSANVHDSQVADKLLHGKEKEEYGDSAYYSKKRLRNSLLRGCLFNVCIKRVRGQELTAYDKLVNRIFSATRSRVEHVFHTVKHLWGHHKTRYRGLMKNGSQRFALLMLQNVYKTRKMKISWC